MLLLTSSLTPVHVCTHVTCCLQAHQEGNPEIVYKKAAEKATS
jgi:hypothetical protein